MVVMDFTLIIPCYNEAGNLPTFFAAATACLDAADCDYELVFVDDGSTDGTTGVLDRAVSDYRNRGGGRATVRVIEFSRNFGKEAGMFAGLEHATGDVIGFIDADMQQDPSVALQMYRCLQENPDYDCVAAVQRKRRESLPLRACKRVFYRAFNDVCKTHLIEDVSDFRVFRRPVAEALLSMREHYRFSKGLFAWVGFRTYVITYEVHERLSGSSKWKVRDLFSYAWNGVLAFSTWPLKLIMYCGLILAVVSLALLGLDLYDKVAYNNDLSTSQLLVYLVLLMSGIQMVVMGVFGEYMARAYIETKKRPLYIARSERVYAADAPAPAFAADAACDAARSGLRDGAGSAEPSCPGAADVPPAGEARPSWRAPSPVMATFAWEQQAASAASPRGERKAEVGSRKVAKGAVVR